MLWVAEPVTGCSQLTNSDEVRGKIVITRRGECMFVDKAKTVEDAGGVGMIVIGKLFVITPFIFTTDLIMSHLNEDPGLNQLLLHRLSSIVLYFLSMIVSILP